MGWCLLHQHVFPSPPLPCWRDVFPFPQIPSYRDVFPSLQARKLTSCERTLHKCYIPWDLWRNKREGVRRGPFTPSNMLLLFRWPTLFLCVRNICSPSLGWSTFYFSGLLTPLVLLRGCDPDNKSSGYVTAGETFLYATNSRFIKVTTVIMPWLVMLSSGSEVDWNNCLMTRHDNVVPSVL